jgi:hypothetical protein
VRWLFKDTSSNKCGFGFNECRRGTNRDRAFSDCNVCINAVSNAATNRDT